MRPPTADVQTTLSRRAWLTSALALMAACAQRSRGGVASPAARAIETVTGPVNADTLGRTLPHEHVLVDFIGAGRGQPATATTPTRSSRRSAAPASASRSRAARRWSSAPRPTWVATRAPAASGRGHRADILTNTGYYGAAGGKHLPEHARRRRPTNWPRDGSRGRGGSRAPPSGRGSSRSARTPARCRRSSASWSAPRPGPSTAA